jgi:7,8-dihydroneopterin aldolase/epimerase/oxygenase
MLTVSLHGILLQAPLGLYPQEHILGNEFEIDVDVFIPTQDGVEWPFADYSIIRQVVTDIFHTEGLLLENFVQQIHTSLKEQFPFAEKIKVAVRKLHPPMLGEVKYSQVCYEG